MRPQGNKVVPLFICQVNQNFLEEWYILLYFSMPDERIEVIACSNYRGEETPRVFILQNEKIEVVEILDMWIEEGFVNRERKRFFKVKGSDGYTHKIYYTEKTMEWFYM